MVDYIHTTAKEDDMGCFKYNGYEIERTNMGVYVVSDDASICGMYPTLLEAKAAIECEFLSGEI